MSTDSFCFKIAIATNDGLAINGHFGKCEQFAIYQFNSQEIDYLESRAALEVDGIEKHGVRAEQLSDCHLLYVASIGGPAAAKVIKHGIHPLKDTNETPINEALARLQTILKGSPPPWMAKLMGTEPSTARFDT